jgi:hypothetical protein
MDELVSLCKRRDIVFPSSEIYGGINSCWDFGPLGAEIKRNIKEAWRTPTGSKGIGSRPSSPTCAGASASPDSPGKPCGLFEATVGFSSIEQSTGICPRGMPQFAPTNIQRRQKT